MRNVTVRFKRRLIWKTLADDCQYNTRTCFYIKFFFCSPHILFNRRRLFYYIWAKENRESLILIPRIFHLGMKNATYKSASTPALIDADGWNKKEFNILGSLDFTFSHSSCNSYYLIPRMLYLSPNAWGISKRTWTSKLAFIVQSILPNNNI